MATERTRQQVVRLRSYVLSKHCAQPNCKLRPCAGRNLCLTHFNRQSRAGSTTAQPLGPKTRRPYVSSFRAVLRAELRRGNNITIISVINELDSFLTNHCQFIPMSDIANKGLGADRKLRGLLANIRRRFPKENCAAVNILSAVCGAWLAVEIEGDEEVKHLPRYRRAMIYNAIFSLVLTPPKKMIVDDKNTGKPVLVKVRRRPRITGRLVHEATDKYITQKLARFIMENKAVRKAALEGVLKHKYSSIRWHDFK